jgi:hypothetical protein
MDAAKVKEAASSAAATGHKVIQDILAHPQVAATTKKIVENPHVAKALADPRVVAAYAKLSDPAVQRHFLTDLKAVRLSVVAERFFGGGGERGGRARARVCFFVPFAPLVALKPPSPPHPLEQKPNQKTQIKSIAGAPRRAPAQGRRL